MCKKSINFADQTYKPKIYTLPHIRQQNQYTIYTKSMKHFLHILVLTFVLVSPLRVLADTVTFDFSSDKGLNALGINKPEKGEGNGKENEKKRSTNLGNREYSIDKVTMKCTSAKTATRIWRVGDQTDLRFYKNGGSITFTVPTGQQITNIAFTGTLESKCNTGKINGVEWTDNGIPTESVTFTANKANYIKTIKITYSSAKPAKPIAKVNSIKELKALESGSYATLSFTDGNNGSMARVLHVYGTGDTQEAYIRDNTGAVCFYGINPNVPFAYNQHLAGQITGEYVLENGVPRFKAIRDKTNTSQLVIAAPITEENVQPKEIEANEYTDNIADWVLLKNQNIINEELTTQGGIIINNRFNSTASKDKYTKPYNGAIIDLAGIAIPNGAKHEINPMYQNGQRAVVFVIDDEKGFVSPQNDIIDAAVRLKRTLSAQYWNTFAVPFDIEYDALENVEIAKFTGKVEGNTMIFEKEQTLIEAGVPYIVKWDIKDPTFESVTLKATKAQTINSNDGQFGFVAIYDPTALALNKTERYLAKDGNLYYPSSPDNKANLLKGLRAYYRVPAGAGAKIAFFGETTGITSPEVLTTPTTINVYNLNGQYMGSSINNLPKGIYIVNGRKLIIN